jgi:Fe-S-cluster containining protein
MFQMRRINAPLSPLYQPLLILYESVEQWHGSLQGISCQRGCSACCTSQVTATEVEAALIHEHLIRNEITLDLLLPASNCPAAAYTTNEFAEACLKKIELEEMGEGDFPPLQERCSFLNSAEECSIYQVRPLMCRLFISLGPCHSTGSATLPEELLTINVALQQILEHMCAGHRWGSLAALMELFIGKNEKKQASESLRVCKTLPGFLLPPEELKEVDQQIQTLFSVSKDGKFLSDFIDENFLREKLYPKNGVFPF